MKPFIFVEPYVSLGAHNFKHLAVIPSTFDRQKIEYLFITEKGLAASERNKRIRNVLTPARVMQALDEASYQQKRCAELKSLLIQYAGSTFVFLTTFDQDFAVWCRLLQEKAIQRSIHKNQTTLFIQSTADLYVGMLEVSSAERSAFKALAGRVFFGFYSDLQAQAACDLVPEMPAIHLTLPTYDFFCQQPLSKKKEAPSFHTYLGRYEANKGPHHVLDLVQAFPRESFLLHFHPVSPDNFLLAQAFRRRIGAKSLLQTKLLNQDQYMRAMKNSRTGLLPYDSYDYAIRASGILEEYLLSGIPVVVPEKSWLAYFLHQQGGGGTTFNEARPEGCARAFRTLLLDWKRHKKTALAARERLGIRLHSTFFLAQVAMWQRGGVRPEGIRLNYEQSELICKGLAHFYARAAQEAHKQGRVGKARQYLHKAFQKDQNYWRTHWLYDTLSPRIKHKSFLSPVRLIKRKEKQNSLLMMISFSQRMIKESDFLKQMRQHAATFFSDSKRRHFLSLKSISFLERFKTSKEAPSHFLSKKRLFGLATAELFMTGLYEWQTGEKAFAQSLLLRAIASAGKQGGLPLEYLDQLETGHLKDCKKLAVAIGVYLSRVESDAGENAVTRYRIASLYQRLDKPEKAIRLFQVLTRRALEPTLQGGAYFHLAQITMCQGKSKQALSYLRQCLRVQPSHREGKRLLQRLKAGIH